MLLCSRLQVLRGCSERAGRQQIQAMLRRPQHQNSSSAAPDALDNSGEVDSLDTGADVTGACREGGQSSSDHSNSSTLSPKRKVLTLLSVTRWST